MKSAMRKECSQIGPLQVKGGNKRGGRLVTPAYAGVQGCSEDGFWPRT